MRQEYRWEFVEIGQGHHHRELDCCFQAAVLNSRKKPDLLIKIEIFRPESEREVIGFLKDGRFLNRIR